MAYYARPTDEITTDIVMTNEDPEYPASNAIADDVAHGIAVPAKATGTDTTFTLTTANVQPRLLVLANHNWHGLNVSIDGVATIGIPPRTADGQCVNAWVDLADYGVIGPATSHTIAVVGAPTPAAIGRIGLYSTKRTLNVLWEEEPAKFRSAWHDSVLATVGGYNIVYNKGFRNRAMEGALINAQDVLDAIALAEATQGRNVPFPVIPWVDRNDALWVRFIENALVWGEIAPDATEATFAVEQWMGLPLGFNPLDEPF